MTTVNPRVIHMVTSPNSVSLMTGQLAYLNKSGFDVTVIASPGRELDQVGKKEKVNTKAIEMKREISPLKDIISLIKIILYFLKVKPDICNAGTPKAGLLGMIAAWLTRVPFRVYTIRGLRFEGVSGYKKWILMLTEKIACFCAHKVICISPSLEKKVINLKLTTQNKTVVIGSGSSNGLQVDNYKSTDYIKRQIKKIQLEYNLNKYHFIIGFVGRVNYDKGIEELVKVFESIQREVENIGLLIIGEKETNNSISPSIKHTIKSNPDIIETGRVENPVPYYYIMDVLVFPTHREGFGNVSIEAQATGTPVITTNATGAIDTVIDRETGYITDIGDKKALKYLLIKLMNNPDLISYLGNNGKERVEREFRSIIIWEGLRNLYRTDFI